MKIFTCLRWVVVAGIPSDHDLVLKVLYCGICHSDLHFIKNDFGFTDYPIVPGHEITGMVTHVGPKVEKFEVGDKAGVGGYVDSCRTCETACPTTRTTVLASSGLTPRSGGRGERTYGGFSDAVVVDCRFAVRLPDSLPPAAAAPLLCAGISVYSPLKYHGLDRPGSRLGVAGLGGLGHVAVKFAKAKGMKVTVISTSRSKEKEALERFAADSFLVSGDPEEMKAARGNLDGIIDTVSAHHSLSPLLDLLKTHGKLIVLGATDKRLEVPGLRLLLGRKLVGGSMIGGMKETQEMDDFAGEYHITADIELIPMEHVNTAMERLAREEVRCRLVVDVGNTLRS